ncbi:two component transcriptional regulator, LuxR family [Gloeothece citriformis PCC 7424]|uniref:Two component transcriptional regulator, LuxR family n=1 Tax=Gloeothece citriformis (strain PCC 7424) TaxID=65393 RepID=B7KEE2_GLOC7|nr:LuxR C-terminal-related transcriptional regulator [Gloeothece citriformis]ACK73260.1 two component transcriptional regulator, LuxR family [Gloeothece citriformis PCC 7424]
MESEFLRFLILEDHPEVAQNNGLFLQQLDPCAIFTIAPTHSEALERLTLDKYDLIIVDLLFGTPTGQQSAQASLELLQQVFQDYPTQNILIYTSEYDYLKPLTQAIGRHQGGFVVVSKLERRKAFLDGAKHALDGKLEIPRELRHHIELNQREMEVLLLLCQESLTDKAIAEPMNLSLKTVQNCVQRLKTKLDVEYLDENHTSTRVALCMEAIRCKIITL